MRIRERKALVRKKNNWRAIFFSRAHTKWTNCIGDQLPYWSTGQQQDISDGDPWRHLHTPPLLSDVISKNHRFDDILHRILHRRPVVLIAKWEKKNKSPCPRYREAADGCDSIKINSIIPACFLPFVRRRIFRNSNSCPVSYASGRFSSVQCVVFLWCVEFFLQCD